VEKKKKKKKKSDIFWDTFLLLFIWLLCGSIWSDTSKKTFGNVKLVV